MLVISVIALLDALFVVYLINTLCPDEQLAMNLFFAIIIPFIVWIIAEQISDMRSQRNRG